MADNHCHLRAPHWLWRRFAGVVGDIGRTSDLKLFMDWQVDNADVEIGPDVGGPHDFLTTLRVDPQRWELFLNTVPYDDGSARLRGYMWWRVQHPDEPLPGRLTPPARRQSKRPVYV